MLEAYTALGFLAAKTERIELLAWVTAVVYRDPGLLAKAVTTLDVLSGGRAWLGIGAAWNEAEANGLGLELPADRGAVRAPGGGAADLPADVERRRQALLGSALPAGTDAELTPVSHPATPADPHRRLGRTQDPAAGGPVRPGVQPVSGSRPRAQARRPAPALRSSRSRLRPDREDDHGPARPRTRRRECPPPDRLHAPTGRSRDHPLSRIASPTPPRSARSNCSASG